MKAECLAILGILVLVLVTGIAPSAADRADGFKPVTGPCGLSFPADHGPHPDYRTEWWYYTGNLTDRTGRRFGFQLTFFRSALGPPRERDRWPDAASAWRTDQVYMAHAAVSDIDGGRHYQAEQMVRPVRGLGGADRTGQTVTIHANGWQAAIGPEGHHLVMDGGDFSLDLDLRSEKPAVMHGDGGYSAKGRAPEEASCYYSFTRLQAQGVVTVAGRPHQVQGSAWMDHEFSTAPLAAEVVGWDWFSLQFNDRSEVMIYRLRQSDGRVHPASSGSWVGPTGQVQNLDKDAVQVQPLAYWTSPHTGARYPVRWRVAIDSLALALIVDANLADQEMRTPRSTAVDYWEGSMKAEGTRAGESVVGVGYVELTGYAEPFAAPM